jgi:hypothetical protein
MRVMAALAPLACAVVLAALLASPGPAETQATITAPADIQLPTPRTTGGMPLLDALAARQSTRAFSDRTLPPQLLSDLLWAAWGVNRPDGRRTAPSARNWQEIQLYVVLPDGAYRYDAAAHALRGVVTGAVNTGSPGASALNLVYVADTERMGGVPADALDRWAWADAAFIAQNVYLFCASEGLATVVRASINAPAIAGALALPDTHRVVLAQTVGFPAD